MPTDAEPVQLLPLFVHPSTDPRAWRQAADTGTMSVVTSPAPGDDLAARALTRLATRATVLGYVDLAYATRPVADLREEVAVWGGYPVAGLFLDHTPSSPFSVGPVAVTVQAARRAGLGTLILNPGVVPDPLYREFGAHVCVFDGAWSDYRRWDPTGARPGDGHLVHSVPTHAWSQARTLMRTRRAGFGLVTDRPLPDPYGGLPGWLHAPAPQAVEVTT